MQENDYKWFLNNYIELYDEYGLQYFAIKNQRVIGAYPSYAVAVKATSIKEKLGTFIVQYCNGRETAYTNYIMHL